MKFSFSLSILVATLGLGLVTSVTASSDSQHQIGARSNLRSIHAHLLQARDGNGNLKKMHKRKSCKSKHSDYHSSSSSSSGTGSKRNSTESAGSDSASGSNSNSTESSSPVAAASSTGNAKAATNQESSGPSKGSSGSSAGDQSSSSSSSKSNDSSASASSSSSSSSSSPGGSGSGGVGSVVSDLVGTTRDGDGTFFATGLGSCGETTSDSDKIVAISHILYDRYTQGGNPNNNSLCGAKVKATYQGKSVEARIVDRCEACKEYDLDFSTSAFDEIADQAIGRMKITWEFI